MLSHDNLLSFPWVQQRIWKEKLFLHVGYFDIQRGELLRYPAAEDRFVALVPAKTNGFVTDG